MTAPYYQDDQITIYFADCRDIMPLLSSVDEGYCEIALKRYDYWKTKEESGN